MIYDSMVIVVAEEIGINQVFPRGFLHDVKAIKKGPILSPARKTLA